MLAGLGVVSLLAILAGAFVFVAYASSGASGLVPRVHGGLPWWEAGPLRNLIVRPQQTAKLARIRYSELLVATSVAYGLALLAARAIPMRVIVAFALLVNLVLVLGPQAPLSDLFNYLGYARLDVVHGLNPYLRVIAMERTDPVFPFTSWHNLSSPYGPLFTAITLPIALLPLPVAYWVLKSLIVAASLGLLAAVYRVARQLGRDARFPLVLLAANPIYVFYAVAGFHNDFVMLLPSVLAIGMWLRGNDRSAGALTMVAVAVKPTAILLLPFLLFAARSRRRAVSVLTGALLALIPLAALSFALFGPALPNLAQQSQLVTGFSFTNLAGLALGLGGATGALLKVADCCVVAVVVWGMRRRDLIGSFGWATTALIFSLAWLMPWYVIWVLPLAGLGSSRALRALALGMTAFVMVTFLPAAGNWVNVNGLDPLNTSVGLQHVAFERYLQYGHHCRSVKIRRNGEVVCAQRRQQRGAQRRRLDLVRYRRADARTDRA